MGNYKVTNQQGKTSAFVGSVEAASAREKLVSGMVEFMSECGVTEIHLNPLNAAIVAESVHHAALGFWQSFETDMLLEALDRHVPSWRQLPPTQLMGMTTGQFIDEVDKQMRLNAFDEDNVERFFALPEGERPADAQTAHRLIFQNIAQSGSARESQALEEFGRSAGERAYELYQCICAAHEGKVYLTRHGEMVKRCRDGARKQRKKA